MQVMGKALHQNGMQKHKRQWCESGKNVRMVYGEIKAVPSQHGPKYQKQSLFMQRIFLTGKADEELSTTIPL